MTTYKEDILAEMEREQFPKGNILSMRKRLTTLEEKARNGNSFARNTLVFTFGYDIDKLDGYDDGEPRRGY